MASSLEAMGLDGIQRYTPQVVLRYVQVCVAGGKQLLLQNMAPQVQQLLNERRVSAQDFEAIRKSLQQPAQTVLAAIAASLMQPVPAQQLLPCYVGLP